MIAKEKRCKFAARWEGQRSCFIFHTCPTSSKIISLEFWVTKDNIVHWNVTVLVAHHPNPINSKHTRLTQAYETINYKGLNLPSKVGYEQIIGFSRSSRAIILSRIPISAIEAKMGTWNLTVHGILIIWIHINVAQTTKTNPWRHWLKRPEFKLRIAQILEMISLYT